MKLKKQAFTLVELIVVITILAILGTIAFVSFQGYTRDARDATRTTDMGNMKKVLSLYITVNNEYPEPTDAEEVTYSGSEVWSQGTFGDSVRSKLGSKANISETPYDPLTYNEYSYSVLNTKREYQIAGIYEGDLTSNLNTTNKTYAAGAYGTTKLAGDYNGKILKLGNCNSLTVLAVPSIIKANTGATDLETIIEGKQLVYDESKLLPSSYSGTTNFKQKLPTEEIVNTSYIKVFTGTCDELTTEANQQAFINNLQQAYSGTVVSDNSRIQPIIDSPTLYTAQTIIHNSIDSDIKVTASNSSNSSGDTSLDCENLTEDNINNLNNYFVNSEAGEEGGCLTNNLDSEGWLGLSSLNLDGEDCVSPKLTKLPEELSCLNNLESLKLTRNSFDNAIENEFSEEMTDGVCEKVLENDDSKYVCIVWDSENSEVKITIEDSIPDCGVYSLSNECEGEELGGEGEDIDYSDCDSMTEENVDNLNDAFDGGVMLNSEGEQIDIDSEITKTQWCDATDLDANRLGIEDVPSEIGFLQNLSNLFLRDNELEKLPSELRHLTGLIELGLDGNESLENLNEEFSSDTEEECQEDITYDGEEMCIEGDDNHVVINVD